MIRCISVQHTPSTDTPHVLFTKSLIVVSCNSNHKALGGRQDRVCVEHPEFFDLLRWKGSTTLNRERGRPSSGLECALRVRRRSQGCRNDGHRWTGNNPARVNGKSEGLRTKGECAECSGFIRRKHAPPAFGMGEGFPFSPPCSRTLTPLLHDLLIQ